MLRRLAYVSLFSVASFVLGACGLDDVGVRSIAFTLSPTAMAASPDGLDSRTLAAFGSSSAVVTVDMHDKMGMVMAAGLPELPDGFSYLVMLQTAEDDRAALPGGQSEGSAGHAHGALTGPAGQTSPLASADDLTAVPAGSLNATTNIGEWMLEVTSSSIGGRSLGTIRAAMIMIIPATGAPVMVLSGQVEEGSESAAGGEEGGGGHDHGV